MTDYNASTGTAGTLIISDNGSRVELVVRCSDPATNSGSVTFDTTMNGIRRLVSVSLPAGFGSRVVRSETVSSSQTVTFNMPATGTSGLGGPTNHSAAISRGPTLGPPVSAPTANRVYDIRSTSALLEFAWPSGGNTGGSPLTGFYTNWAESPTEPIGVGDIVTVGQPAPMSPLRPLTRYWCSVLAMNAYGSGPWSNALEFVTLSGVFVSDGVTWIPGPVFVDDGSTMQPAELYVSDGTSWKASG